MIDINFIPHPLQGTPDFMFANILMPEINCRDE